MHASLLLGLLSRREDRLRKGRGGGGIGSVVGKRQPLVGPEVEVQTVVVCFHDGRRGGICVSNRVSGRETRDVTKTKSRGSGQRRRRRLLFQSLLERTARSNIELELEAGGRCQWHQGRVS